MTPSHRELLAAQVHAVYQKEARRQGDVRHPDNYEDLPENVKEFDRVIVDHFASYIKMAEAGWSLRESLRQYISPKNEDLIRYDEAVRAT